ncbi:MAG TPA: peptide chain release factor 3 [Ignavibacteriaceae bacterium]|nr:peptide chain release factor 3 [Ignavibacteriaceae bacterium]
MSNIKEINKRRTFAIISHPDAGKTTLTEKFLLYGGAVHLAGSVTARKNQRSSTSDWMELEKKRGISISSTVLQFDYKEYKINLLDTPGHEDFSEDTYRVLTAVDAVVMVIDAAKGIEAQTRKLFEVCRRREIPIFTFMNKLDRPTKDPLELIDELESILGIGAFPMNYPLGTGLDFRGVYDRLTKQVHLFERTIGGSYIAPVEVYDLNNPLFKEKLNEENYAKFIEELEMLNIAGEDFNHDAVVEGKLTPVFFGSAMNNFGVQLLLDSFLDYAVPPAPRKSISGIIKPDDDKFSGFIFKIQANMDPKHRDRIAFMRVCSGRFERDMQAYHSNTGKKIRLSNSQKLFGQERETINEAYAGDIVGFVGNSNFGIGDTITEEQSILYKEIPHFAPEHFIFINNPNPSDYKKFRDGLEQLLQEGVIQAFYIKNAAQKIPLLGAVGPLQFEVVQYRLESEYGAKSRLEQTNWKVMRWFSDKISGEEIDKLILPAGAAIATDKDENFVILFTSEYSMNYFKGKYPEVELGEVPFERDQLVMKQTG